MQKAHPRAALLFGFFPILLGAFLIVPSISGAAILYGPDAHKKDYVITATPLLGNSTSGWGRFGKGGALGMFLSVAKDGSSDRLSPEVLLLPCDPERPCVSLSLEEPPILAGVFSFLHTADTLAVDALSADDLERMAQSLCSLKERNVPQGSYRAFIDVVMEDGIIHKELTGTGCDLLYPKKHNVSFLYRTFVHGVSNN